MIGRTHLPPLPPARVLSLWWPTLLTLRPAAILAGWLTLLRTEVLINRVSVVSLDPMATAILSCLAAGEPLAGLDRILHLGSARLHALIQQAEKAGWICSQSGTLTDRGHLARVQGLSTVTRTRVRETQRLNRPIPWNDSGPLLLEATESIWVGPHDDRSSWGGVPVSRREMVSVVIVQTDEPAPRIVAIPCTGSDWTLDPQPVCEGPGPETIEVFPEFVAEDSAASQNAWHSWAKFRTIPPELAETARATLTGLELRIPVDSHLESWLRTHRADAFTADHWVWVGEGDLRRGARLVLQPTTP